MLRAGFAREEITPPPGALLAAFPRGPERTSRRALGAHDPLYVKALALSNGETTVCLCVGDVLSWRPADVTQVRNEIARRHPGFAPQNLMLAGTHTHSSGENTYVFGGSPGDPWVSELKAKTVEAVSHALDDLSPAALSAGQVEAPFNHNRRALGEDGRMRLVLEYRPGLTEGPTDPTLTVLRFARSNGAELVWVHWTAHALTLGPANDFFSADYPGAMSRLVQAELTGAEVLFTNGAAGNVHPKWCMRPDASALEQVGRALAERVLAAARASRPIDTPALDLSTDYVAFTNRVDPSLSGAAEVGCLRLGPIYIGLLPGEPFVEFQLRFREALAPRMALVVGYANGSAGYLPTKESYAEGGYGVDMDRGDAPELSRTMVPPGTGELVLETLLRLARSNGAAVERGTLDAGP